MATTPLIKKISNPNGTFIAFQSAINDSNLIGSQQGYRFSFSKYALIKIPKIIKATIPANSSETYEETSPATSGVSGKNYMNLDAIGDKFNTSTNLSHGYLSKEFAESFQNYCLNLESAILTSVDKRTQLNANVSEEIFFKWLKECGAIRFVQAQSGDNGYVRENQEPRFMEPVEVYNVNDDEDRYERVVKYINDISAVNVTMDGSVYTEVYIYTPTDHGQSPVVLFSSGDNDLYKERLTYSSPSEWIYGRDKKSVHPDNLDMEAIFDYDGDSSKVESLIFDKNEGKWVSGHWYDGRNLNSSTGYYIIDSIGSTDDIDIKKTDSSRETTFRRSTLDGIKIDWNVSKTYSLNSFAPGIKDEDASKFTLNKFNTLGVGECREFDYNAALLYYDLTDVVTGESKSYLYGIYFIDKVTDDETGSAYIPTVTKYRSGSLDVIEGNAIGYKINLRTDTSYENLENISTSTASRTFSMDLFHESLSVMKIFSDTLNGKLEYISSLYEELEKMRRLFVDDQNKDEILKRIDTLETEFKNFKGLDYSVDFLSNTESFIRDLYKKYNEILSNKTPIKVEYSYDKYKINSLVTHNQNYNIQPGKYKGNIFTEGGNILKLNEFSNYYKHYVDYETDYENYIVELNENFDLYIDDSENKWIAGQTFRLVFASPIEMVENVQISIKTDSKNIAGFGEYGVVAAVITPDMVKDKVEHIFEIICVDPDKMEFEFDQVK